ncbi:MAG: Fur family transcriptional regulator [Thermoanaerobaculia bacterium]
MGTMKRALEQEVERFRGYLQQQGLKLTNERDSLVREIFSTHYHFEAEELLEKLRKKKTKISRATIYRTLELLVKSGMVRRVHLGEDHYHYERVMGDDAQHGHLICTTCGAVIEFHDEALEARQLQICEKNRFTPTFHNLQILGVCGSCRKKGEEPEVMDRLKSYPTAVDLRR